MTWSARLVRWRTWSADRSTALGVAVLAGVAYIPALLSAPGRMPADTKLYLYLDPGGLLRRASSTFEPDQFAGWVPHQQITYLWPSGPWYWCFDRLGVPDWIAHRLWIGTVLFLAGWGVHRLARRVGIAGAAALAAGLLYQLSPYLLPYISRTSLLLLPWAGLGWIVALTVGATNRAAAAQPDGEVGRVRRALAPWREPALIALVVLTVGSVNATALLLVAPAPALWLVHAASSRLVTWRSALAIAGRTAVLCVLVSLWWVAMLVVQARHGAPVLAYSETLADVSRNSTGSEVLRGLGYWLFYVRDPFAPTTSAAADYLTSTRQLAVGYAVALVGLAGLAFTTWAARRFAALLVAVGAVLAVGVHPIGSSSPLMSLLATDDGSGIALALRSSTRAVPLLVLGVALGAGALVAAVPTHPLGRRTLPRARSLAAGLVVVLVLLNLPALWRVELVDPAIDRDERPPAAWTEAAAALDAGGDGRVLQLPGAEFGAFRWGYTVDQPLVGLTDRPLVTRDLLPLGSAGAMDLLYALDDRFQEGTVEPGAVGPVARLLGVDTVWVANDLEFERFRTPRPEVVDALLTAPPPDWVGDVRRFGEPITVTPSVPMIDGSALADGRVGTSLAPVVLVDVEDADGVVRVKTATVLLAGSGDGIVDAAAAGVLSGHELILPSAALDDVARREALAAGTPLVVTDSNRDRAHHWRGSQDVHGHTEPGGPGADVLDETAADQRLDPFDTADPALQTVAVQEGPVTAVASSYGEPFAYLPEHRAVMAVDGDPGTAWLVGGHGDPVGERIRLTVDAAAPVMRVVQPVPAPGGRRIAAVDIRVDDGPAVRVELTEESATPGGQTVELGLAGPATVEVEIAAVTAGDPAQAASRAAVGFAELDLGLGPTTELIRPPVATLDDVGDTDLAIVLTRLRVDPLDRWRADPEPELARLVPLPAARTFEAAVTLRLDHRASDDTLRSLLLEESAPVADRRLGGAPRNGGWAALDGDPATSWITPFDGALGATLTVTSDEPVGPVLELTQPTGSTTARITDLRIADAGTGATFDVAVPPPDATGRSSLTVPGPVGPGTVTFTIVGTDGATTVDRRFGDVVTLPAAIRELRSTGLATFPLDEAAEVSRTCTPDLLEIDGVPVPLSFRTTVGALFHGDPVTATICDGPLRLGPGEHRIVSTGRAAGLTSDRLVLTDGFAGPAPADASAPARVEVDDARRRLMTVEECPDGCWLVLGEGYNDAWSARVDGRSLGPPTQVDGGFNGWRLAPTAGPVTVELTWTAQTPVTVGLIVSALAALACLAVIAIGAGAARRRPLLPARPPSPRWAAPSGGRQRAVVAAVALVAASALLVGPAWGLVAAVVGAVLVLLAVTRPATRFAPRLLESAGWTAALLVSLGAIAVLRRNRPLPDAGWTATFERFNGLTLFAVVCLAVGAWYSSPDREHPR